MKIDFKALAKFEKGNTTNYISANTLQQMLDTVINYTGTDTLGAPLVVPPNYILAIETLTELGIIKNSPVSQQLNS